MDNTNNGSLSEQFDHALAQLTVLGSEMLLRWYRVEEKYDDQVRLTKTHEPSTALSNELADKLQLRFDEEKKSLEAQVSKLQAEVEELKVAQNSGAAISSNNDDAVRALGEMNIQHARVVKELSDKINSQAVELFVARASGSHLANQRVKDLERIKELEQENDLLREDLLG